VPSAVVRADVGTITARDQLIRPSRRDRRVRAFDIARRVQVGDNPGELSSAPEVVEAEIADAP
jgi:hypothetical protein